MGLGGGFMMTIHHAATGATHSLDAREAAPAAASPHMFRGQPELATHGALSVAVPGEVAGYWAAKQRFGNPALAWAELVQPAIELCNKGGWSQAGHESGEYCRN